MFAKLPPAAKPAVPSRVAGARSPDRGVQNAEPARVTPFALSRTSHFALTERGVAGRTLAAPPENDVLEGEADQLADRALGSRTLPPPHATQQEPGAPTRYGPRSGRPLDAATRARMESGFGHTFANVRVHAGDEAAQATRNIGARAFTSGPDIFFGRGEYQPQNPDGSRLVAHELAHVLQQKQGGRWAGQAGVLAVQRNAIPVQELRRMRDDIDIKLANPKLAAPERARLLEERRSLSRSIGDEDLAEDTQQLQDPPHRPRPSRGVPLPPPDLTATDIPTRPGTAKPVKSRTKGAGASRQKSALALAKSEQTSPTVPPPSTPYVNRDTKAKPHEIRAGKRLNELAIEGKLGPDVRRVEGRPPGEGRVGDYVLILRDGKEVTADLYSPGSRGRPEDIARHAETKSGQAEILVVELPGKSGPKTLELAHQIADALIANANTKLKRMLVMADNKLVMDRALAKTGRELLRVQQRVQQRTPRPMDLRPGSLRQETREGGRTRLPFETSRLSGASEALGRQEAKTDAIAGAAQMILAFQFDALQSAEVNKIYKRLEELTPRIDALRASGYRVEVWGKAEVPDTIDIAAGITGVRDASQVVYFVDLWITPSRVNAEPGRHQTMSGDPTAPRRGDRNFKEFAREGWHFVTGHAFTYEPYLDPSR